MCLPYNLGCYTNGGESKANSGVRIIGAPSKLPWRRAVMNGLKRQAAKAIGLTNASSTVRCRGAA